MKEEVRNKEREGRKEKTLLWHGEREGLGHLNRAIGVNVQRMWVRWVAVLPTPDALKLVHNTFLRVLHL